MSKRKIVPHDEWFRAHKEHLKREKELTRLRDRIAAERRELPWLKIRKDYVFETGSGPRDLAEMFGNNSQLIVYHFMLGPGDNHYCEGCSFLCDHIDGANQHLRHHDVSLVVVARAPLAELLPFRKRMGWKFDMVSSYASDFNFDMQVSYTDKQIAAGETIYNFETRPITIRDLPGISVFFKDDAGNIFLTFVSRARGGEPLITTYDYLDMTPKGRNENGPYHGMIDWMRLHDEYEDTTTAEGSCCR